MRYLFLAWGYWCVACAAEPPKFAPSALNGLVNTAKFAEERSQATLDGGSTIGLIPLSSSVASKTLSQYAIGFFQDDNAKGVNEIPDKVLRLASVLPELKSAGATHIVALSHEGAGEVEYIRFVALGEFSEPQLSSLEKAGLGRRGGDGAFELLVYMDGKEQPIDSKLPPLPIVRLMQMARQLASESDCSVDIVKLASADAARIFEDALKEAFSEEGEVASKVRLPAKARLLVAQLQDIKAMGVTHLVVTSFQSRRGSDVVLVVAKGMPDADAFAKTQAGLGSHILPDGTIVLARWVDGEDRSSSEPPVTVKADSTNVRRVKSR